MNIFQAVGEILDSVVRVVTASARTCEKTVTLVEKEVDILHIQTDNRTEEVLNNKAA